MIGRYITEIDNLLGLSFIIYNTSYISYNDEIKGKEEVNVKMTEHFK